MTSEKYENSYNEKNDGEIFQKHENLSDEFYEKIDFKKKNDGEFFND